MQALTMSEIATQTGLSKTTVRNYFHAKKLALQEGVDYYFESRLHKTTLITPSGISKIIPRSRLEQAVVSRPALVSYHHTFQWSVC